MSLLRRAMVAMAFSAGVLSASAQDATVPGENIFGFTDPTDVGNPGDTALKSENTGRLGKRMGRYFALESKTELSRTLGENLLGAVSLFNSYYRVLDVPDIDRNLTRAAFDGLSFEIVRRVVERSATNPFAVSLAFEPRWSRFDVAGGTGTRAEAFSAEAKLFIDAAVVPGKLFWAMNLNYAPATQRSREPGAKWVESAEANISTALTYAWSPSVFTGGEVRFVSAFEKAFFSRYAGSALYVGPTFAWKISDKAVFNAVWTAQVAGRSQTNKDRVLDLDNFERHHFRAAFAMQF